MRTAFHGMLLAALAGCGGGHGTSGTAQGPMITDVSAEVTRETCGSEGIAGQAERVAFAYVDADGDLHGGEVTLKGAFEPSGVVLSATYAIPAPSVSVTGRTEGTVQVAVCLQFGDQTRVSHTVTVRDAAGHVSNELTASVRRPAGAAQRPARTTPGPG